MHSVLHFRCVAVNKMSWSVAFPKCFDPKRNNELVEIFLTKWRHVSNHVS